MDTKCKRCKAKESIFACMECDKFRFLCGRCDDYLHNLPNKSKHKRVAIKENDSKQPSQQLQQKSIQQLSPSSYESISKEANESNTIHQVEVNDNTINKLNQSNNSNYSNQADIVNVNLSSNRDLNHSQSQTINDKDINRDKPYCYSNEYSRTYLNELKSTIEQDKHDLLYQNNAIMGSINKLQQTFSDQIHSIITEVSKYQASTEESAFSLENRLNAKYANCLNEKEIEISILKSTIADLQKQNSDISLQLTNTIESFHQQEINYQRQIKQLESDMIKKEEELYMTKGNLDEVVGHSNDKLVHETNAIKIDSEKRIQNILNEADTSRDALLKVINERENDIRSLIETNRNQRDEFNGVILALKKENDEYRNQICEVLTQKNQLEEDIRYLNKGNNQMTSKTQEQDTIIAKMAEDNEKLIKENSTLKGKIEKMDGMLYGKVKTSTSWK